jgi:hypothetical protein
LIAGLDPFSAVVVPKLFPTLWGEPLKDKPPAERLRYRVKQGTKHALVAGKSVYAFEGHEAELDKYSARKVTVKAAQKSEP